MHPGLGGEGLALPGPLERLSHGAVEVLDEGQHLGFQVLNGGEASALEQLAHQNAEPDFHLVHPGGMFGRVVKDDTMRRVAQESSTGGHGLQDAALGLDTQVQREVGLGSHIPHESLGLMGVQIVGHEMPLGDRRISLDRVPDMICEVRFGAGLATRGRDHLPTGDIEVDDQRLRTVPHVFELPPFDLARSQGKTWMLALQGLHAGQLVGAEHPFTRLRQFGCLLVQRVDVCHLLLELLVGCWRQPVANQVRLESTRFLKAGRHAEARGHLRCRAG